MTENTNVGAPGLKGAGENQPPVSQEQEKPIAGTTLSPQELLDLRKEIELTRKELKGLQSVQDKGQNEVQRFMAEVKKQMANGKSLEEAEQAVTASREAQQKDDLLLRIARKVGVLDDVSPAQSAGNGAAVTNEAATVLSQYQLSANDPDVMAKLNLQGSEFRAAMADLAFRRATKQPPDAAASSTIAAGPPPAEKPVDMDALTAEQTRLMRNPTANYKRLAEIREILKA